MNLWCLNVGSAVTAWETLGDVASERVEMVAMQEVKSFDIRAAALGYACFGVPQVKTGGKVLPLRRSGKPGAATRHMTTRDSISCWKFVGTQSALTPFHLVGDWNDEPHEAPLARALEGAGAKVIANGTANPLKR